MENGNVVKHGHGTYYYTSPKMNQQKGGTGGGGGSSGRSSKKTKAQVPWQVVARYEGDFKENPRHGAWYIRFASTGRSTRDNGETV
jgi:hypothetical protein